VKGKTAGGCSNEPTWKESPQFILELPADDKVKLSLKQLQKVDDKYHHIGFVVMKSEPSKKRKFQTVDVVHQTPFLNRQTNAADIELPAGAYNILACTFHPNLENTFELSVQTNYNAKLYELTPDFDWKKTSIKGQWTAGRDGGCSNNRDTWTQNPTFCLDVKRKSGVKLIVDVLEGIQTGVGYYVFETQDGKKESKLVGGSTFVQGSKNLSVAKDWDLEPAKYLVRVATFDPNHHASFILTALSDYQCPQTIVK